MRHDSTTPTPRVSVLLPTLALTAVLTLAGCTAPGGATGDTGANGSDAASGARNEPALSQSPVADALYRCITAKGWPVTISEEGGIEASSETIPKEQYELYLADTWSCNTQVARQFPVDDEQKNLLYTAELTERDCLEAHGYSVDSPPTLQSFLDDYATAPWSAMASSEVAALSQTMSDDDWRAINRACPQPVPGALH